MRHCSGTISPVAISGEFFPHRPKYLMQVALALALVTFAFLAFGQTSTGQFSGTASLYQYFGATVVILIVTPASGAA